MGKLSPFTSATSGEVTDQGYSYITNSDIERVQAEQEAAKSNRPSRDTDVVLLKHRKVSYPVHFPSYSIDDGELTVGAIRKAGAKKVELSEKDAGRIKLFFRGKDLKDDSRTAREVGMKSDAQSEILLVVGEAQIITRPESSGDEDESEAQPGKAKKKRNRRKNKKKSSGPGESSGSSTPNQGYTGTNINPDATFAPSAAPLPRAPASQVPKPVLTASQKLDTLASLFHTSHVPQCVTFMANPPEDPVKQSFEHKKLTETILTQVLLKLDAVETEGDEEARQKRKALVKEVQGMLNQLDAVVKKM